MARIMAGPKPAKAWRLSSSVVIAAHSSHVPAPPAHLRLGSPGGDYRICMVMRTAKASFMPKALVFPGGAVDAADSKSTAAICGSSADGDVLRLAGFREVLEESGILLAGPGAPAAGSEIAQIRSRLRDDAGLLPAICESLRVRPDLDRLKFWCSFVTPDFEAARVKKGGFDARFYLCVANKSELEHASSDAQETTDLIWLSPAEALAACASGAVYMAPPQFSILSELAELPRIDTLADAASWPSRRVLRDYPTKPEAGVSADRKAILVLPGDEIHPVFTGQGGCRNRIYWAGKMGVKPDYRLERTLPADIDLGDPQKDVYRGVGLSRL